MAEFTVRIVAAARVRFLPMHLARQPDQAASEKKKPWNQENPNSADQRNR
jgi:hypothetical protein